MKSTHYESYLIVRVGRMPGIGCREVKDMDLAAREHQGSENSGQIIHLFTDPKGPLGVFSSSPRGQRTLLCLTGFLQWTPFKRGKSTSGKRAERFRLVAINLTLRRLGFFSFVHLGKQRLSCKTW